MQGLLGIPAFLGLAWLLSEARDRVRWRLVFAGLLLQLLGALCLLHIPPLRDAFLSLNHLVLALEAATRHGSSFMFGYLGGGPLPFQETGPGGSFIIAFQVLPIVLIMSALSAMLFHWGVLQRLVRLLSRVLEGTMGISGVQGLGVAANVFLGIVEAPLLIRPYLASMTRSSLFTVMTAGMATVAGTVMVLYASLIKDLLPGALGHILVASLISAPAAVVVAQVMVPETEDPEAEAHLVVDTGAANTFDALVHGTNEGVQLVLAIVGMIVVLFSLVHLLDQALALLPAVGGEPVSIQAMVALAFRPLVWLMGIPAAECTVASQLMSTKTVLNEFVSYRELASLATGTLSPRSTIILTYAMCGFANLASVGLLVGSLGNLVPERRAEVAALGFRALASGTLATCLTGAIVGLVH